MKTIKEIEDEISKYGSAVLKSENHSDDPFFFQVVKEDVGYSIYCENLNMNGFTLDNSDNGISTKTCSIKDILDYMCYIYLEE